MVVEYNRELHRLAIAEGADLIVLGDDYAHKTGTIMSPAHFREFVLPGLAEVVQNIKSHGAYCVKHTDGNIWAILDDIVNTGIDGLGPLEPGGGHILSSGNSITSAVQPENFRAMVETAHEHGRYPIVSS